jgi:hypothetical protein
LSATDVVQLLYEASTPPSPALQVLKYQDVYENFLRCIYLFNAEIVTRAELVKCVTPFLGRFPELLAAFKVTLGHSDLAYSEPVAAQGQCDVTVACLLARSVFQVFEAKRSETMQT